ncbi:MAG TPA: NAD(P)H-dependent oxidoreductase [Acidimicrobiia bacterium]|nr:NAD(P)H-dependent oxidoreductase [Acidimicrobiia bacterium]
MKIVGISGSLRDGSANTKLLEACARLLPDNIDFEEANIDLPLFTGNFGNDLPKSVETIRELVSSSDAMLITCPEHNWNMTAAMKNAIDWLSMGGKDSPLNNHVAALAGVGGGRLGSVRAQMAIRSTLLHDRVWVVPGPEVLIAPSETMFDKNGDLTDPIAIALVKNILDELIRVSPQLRTKA